PIAPGRLHLYQRNDLVRLRWEPEGGPWRLEIATDGTLLAPPTPGTREQTDQRLVLEGAAPRPIYVRLTTRGGSALRVQADVDGRPLPPEAYALGPAAETPKARWLDGTTLRLPLSLWWLPVSLLVQLLLVALPEEFFYRGYLQRRMD